MQAFLLRKRGILEMATGTGKTRTALRIAKHLVATDDIRTVIIAADGTDLLNQWYTELLQLTRELVPHFSLHRHYSTHHGQEHFSLSPKYAILLTSRFALPRALRRLSPEVAIRTLLVHDEVHRLGSPGNRSNLRGLSSRIRFRLGLSATPEREYDDAGTSFVEDDVGPVIFEFTLADAIRRGILSPFIYHPLTYYPNDDDRHRIQQVYRRQAALQAQGEPMREVDLLIALARVHKTSKAKLPIFDAYIHRNLHLLKRCIIFVETVAYGLEVLSIVHHYRHDFHQYFTADDADILRRFARGELECLLTCHRLSEGIDIQNLRSVILFSSARSRLETIQRIGRCLRRDPADPNKRAHVVDFIREADDEQHTSADSHRATWLAELATITPEE